MSESKHSPRKVNAAIRREELLEDRAAGMTFDRIAAKHGISVRRTRNLIAEEFDRLKETRAEYAQELVRKQVKRLDDLLEAVWDNAMEGDVKSIGAALAVIDRGSRMLGLDAPAKSDGTLRFSDMTGEELMRQAARMGLLPSPAPAALPEPPPAPAAPEQEKAVVDWGYAGKDP